MRVKGLGLGLRLGLGLGLGPFIMQQCVYVLHLEEHDEVLELEPLWQG